MFGFGKKKEPLDSKAILDAVEKEIYAYLKPLGFRRHGRTLHRFVDGDISQVVNFQTARIFPGGYYVNLGIRVPECAERTFSPSEEKKAFYYEYDCNLRFRLGESGGKEETWFDLSKPVGKQVKTIAKELEKTALPAFEAVNSREAFLARYKELVGWSTLDRGLLDECMVHGHMGDLTKAQELFEACYRERVAEYNRLMKNGRQFYLEKGQRMVYMGQVVTAEKNGYVTLYGANRGHIEYLEKLAAELGLSVPREETV